jgi:CubicO group peptidase (beta-lactamase class C family)
MEGISVSFGHDGSRNVLEIPSEKFIFPIVVFIFQEKKLPMKLLLSLFILLFSANLVAQPDLKKLDAYYAKAVKDWGVPGLSIAIVKDGKVVFAKGYGTKELGKNEPPDENTLYAIASNSKAFTSAAIAQLVDEGKLSWNDKVIKYLPYFQLSDPYVTSEATIEDILSHRIGLGTFSGDLIWYRSNLGPVEIIKRIKYLKPSYSFRAGYGYANVMFVTAGEVMKQITGETWGTTIQKRFFEPLGMTRSITTAKDLDKKGNYATPHALVDDKHKPVKWEDWENVEATAGILSSAKDMSQWMIFNLNNGIWKSDTLLSPSSRNILWSTHNSFSVNYSNSLRISNFFGYGLGWFVSDYKGKFRVHHTGGYSGMLSAVSLIPEEKLGIVILTNGMVPVYTPLINYTIDAFLKLPAKDWSRESLDNYNKNKAADTRIEEREKKRVLNTKPSLPLESYVGEYHNPSYGKITVRLVDNNLKISFEHTPSLAASLEHWHFDTFKLNWDDEQNLSWFRFGTVKFTTDNNARVKGIEFDVPNDDFWFDELNADKIK